MNRFTNRTSKGGPAGKTRLRRHPAVNVRQKSKRSASQPSKSYCDDVSDDSSSVESEDEDTASPPTSPASKGTRRKSSSDVTVDKFQHGSSLTARSHSFPRRPVAFARPFDDRVRSGTSTPVTFPTVWSDALDDVESLPSPAAAQTSHAATEAHIVAPNENWPADESDAGSPHRHDESEGSTARTELTSFYPNLLLVQSVDQPSTITASTGETVREPAGLVEECELHKDFDIYGNNRLAEPVSLLGVSEVSDTAVALPPEREVILSSGSITQP